MGRRTKKVANGTTTLYVYDQSGLLIAEYTGDGTWEKDYVYLNGQPLAMIVAATPETVYYYHNDHLGTPQIMTDSVGAVVWEAVYDPFGEATITVEQITNNLRFPGQYFDAETGLHNNWHRDYNNELGRYIESDPIGLWGGTNLFSYVGGNPMNKKDPEGLLGWGDVWRFLGKQAAQYLGGKALDKVIGNGQTNMDRGSEQEKNYFLYQAALRFENCMRKCKNILVCDTDGNERYEQDATCVNKCLEQLDREIEPYRNWGIDIL